MITVFLCQALFPGVNYVNSFNTLKLSYEVNAINSILPNKKTKTKGHTAGKRKSQNSN